MQQHEEGQTPALVRIYGTPQSSHGYAIRDFLHRSDVPFEWVPLVTDEDARTHAGVQHLRFSFALVCILQVHFQNR